MLSTIKEGAMDIQLRRRSLAFSGLTPGVRARHRVRAFTLIELLVVIAIIAILAAILMPVLTRAKMRAQTAYCLNNMKQLQLAYLMYIHDNNDYCPPVAIGGVGSWITNGNEQANVLLDGIRGGVLYQYNQNAKIYDCPANTKTTVCPSTDVINARKEYGDPGISSSTRLPMVRTCSINYPVGGFNVNGQLATGVLYPVTKYTQIKSPNPAPAQMFVFVDENEYSIDDGCFAMYPTGTQNEWWNLPGSRHDRGSTWSFADGHVEYWKWHGTAVLTFTAYYQAADPTPPSPGSSDDLSRVQACTCTVNNGP
jgi:prepilin-type N-terminal cleavage/methylation domain-containing protein/prepilin-type processing-associated H-X9-DG protein